MFDKNLYWDFLMSLTHIGLNCYVISNLKLNAHQVHDCDGPEWVAYHCYYNWTPQCSRQLANNRFHSCNSVQVIPNVNSMVQMCNKIVQNNANPWHIAKQTSCLIMLDNPQPHTDLWWCFGEYKMLGGLFCLD